MRMRVVMAFVAALAVATAGHADLDAQSPAPAQARQKPPTPPPAPPAEGATTRPDAPPPPPATPTRDGRTRKVGPNVRIEVTFTEQRSDTPAQPKTVSVTTGDGHWGRVRAQAHSSAVGATPLNVDVRPEVQADGRVVVALTLEHGDKRVVEVSPQTSGPVTIAQPKQVTDVNMNQSVTVVLESGKPLVVTQAADPTGDRKVTVEVKATILR